MLCKCCLAATPRGRRAVAPCGVLCAVAFGSSRVVLWSLVKPCPCGQSHLAMSRALLDSEAAFHDALKERNLLGKKVKFENEGWTTFGRFAMSSDYVPGSGDPAVLHKIVVEPVLGDMAEGVEKKTLVMELRRLYVEAYTLMAASMKAMVERTDDDVPKTIPAPEREHRHAKQQERLTGLTLSGELEPSHRLQDLVNGMHESNTCQWVDWYLCTNTLPGSLWREDGACVET